jgi:hypothetical protein
VTRRLLESSITPHQLTALAGLVAFVGVALVFRATWWTVALGSVLVQASSILDGCDGELARLRYDATRLGEWLDYVLDNLVNAAYGVALGWASSRLLGDPLWFRLGAAAAFGYAFYDLTVYAQLLARGKGPDHFAFRWWFQGARQPHVIEALSGRDRPRLLAFLHALSRRDVFLFAFMGFALLGAPQLAVLWYALLAAGHVVLTALHLLRGGARSRPAIAR